MSQVAPASSSAVADRDLDNLTAQVFSSDVACDLTDEQLEAKYTRFSDEELSRRSINFERVVQNKPTEKGWAELARFKAEILRRRETAKKSVVNRQCAGEPPSASKRWVEKAKQNQRDFFNDANTHGEQQQHWRHVSVAGDKYDLYNDLDNDFQPRPPRREKAPAKAAPRNTRGARQQQAAASSGGRGKGRLGKMGPPSESRALVAKAVAVNDGQQECNACRAMFHNDLLRPAPFPDAKPNEMLCELCCTSLNYVWSRPSANNGKQWQTAPGNKYGTLPLDMWKVKPAALKQGAVATQANGGLGDSSGAERGKGIERYARRSAKEGTTKETAVNLADTDDEAGADEVGPSGRQGPRGRQGPDAEAHARKRPKRAVRHQTTSERFQGLQAVYPPGGGTDAVEVVASDLSRLDPLEFLNDTCIDFYTRWLRDQLPEHVASRCHFFNSFFYKKLSEPPPAVASAAAAGASPAKCNYHKVQKWTKGVDIFSKDFLFVPIHDALHWSLVVVCYPGHQLDIHPDQIPCVLHLDSMNGGHTSAPIFALVQDYLQQEWEHKTHGGEGDGLPARWAADHPGVPRVFDHITLPRQRVSRQPKQQNHCDCGLFLLAYMEFFCAALPQRIASKQKGSGNGGGGQGSGSAMQTLVVDVPSITESSGYASFLQHKWFDPSNASNLRYHLRDLMLRQMLQQTPPPPQATAAAATLAGDQGAGGSGDGGGGGGGGQLEELPALEEARQEIDQYRGTSSRYYPPGEWLAIAAAKREEEAEKVRRKAVDRDQQAKRRAAQAAEQRAAKRKPKHKILDSDDEDAGGGGGGGAGSFPAGTCGVMQQQQQEEEQEEGGGCGASSPRKRQRGGQQQAEEMRAAETNETGGTSGTGGDIAIALDTSSQVSDEVGVSAAPASSELWRQQQADMIADADRQTDDQPSDQLADQPPVCEAYVDASEGDDDSGSGGARLQAGGEEEDDKVQEIEAPCHSQQADVLLTQEQVGVGGGGGGDDAGAGAGGGDDVGDDAIEDFESEASVGDRGGQDDGDSDSDDGRKWRMMQRHVGVDHQPAGQQQWPSLEQQQQPLELRVEEEEKEEDVDVVVEEEEEDMVVEEEAPPAAPPPPLPAPPLHTEAEQQQGTGKAQQRRRPRQQPRHKQPQQQQQQRYANGISEHLLEGGGQRQQQYRQSGFRQLARPPSSPPLSAAASAVLLDRPPALCDPMAAEMAAEDYSGRGGWGATATGDYEGRGGGGAGATATALAQPRDSRSRQQRFVAAADSRGRQHQRRVPLADAGAGAGPGPRDGDGGGGGFGLDVVDVEQEEKGVAQVTHSLGRLSCEGQELLAQGGGRHLWEGEVLQEQQQPTPSASPVCAPRSRTSNAAVAPALLASPPATGTTPGKRQQQQQQRGHAQQQHGQQQGVGYDPLPPCLKEDEAEGFHNALRVQQRRQPQRQQHDRSEPLLDGEPLATGFHDARWGQQRRQQHRQQQHNSEQLLGGEPLLGGAQGEEEAHRPLECEQQQQHGRRAAAAPVAIPGPEASAAAGTAACMSGRDKNKRRRVAIPAPQDVIDVDVADSEAPSGGAHQQQQRLTNAQRLARGMGEHQVDSPTQAAELGVLH